MAARARKTTAAEDDSAAVVDAPTEAMPSAGKDGPDRVAMPSVRADGEPDHPAGFELIGDQS